MNCIRVISFVPGGEKQQIDILTRTVVFFVTLSRLHISDNIMDELHDCSLRDAKGSFGGVRRPDGDGERRNKKHAAWPACLSRLELAENRERTNEAGSTAGSTAVPGTRGGGGVTDGVAECHQLRVT